MNRLFFFCTVVLGGALLLSMAPVKPAFEDVSARSGIQFRHAASKTSEKYLPESMGAGVAMLDYNNDRLLDLFFVNGAAFQDPMPDGTSPDKSEPRFWNRLYKNNGDGTFTDVTETSRLRGEGYGMGVATGDVDNDGYVDLYVTNLDRNHLYRNNGNGVFTDVTTKAGVAASGWSVGAAFVDYDSDGHLDLFVSRYLDWDFSRNEYCGQRREGYRAYCHPDRFKPVTHLLYRNKGDGTFEDMSARSGIARVPSKGLGVAIDDFNRDGHPDIAVANDSFPQQLFRNDGDGTFSDVAADLGIAYDEDGKTFAGMGIDTGDFNRDRWPDVFINALALQRYALFKNSGGQAFDYVSGSTGISRITMNHSGWGAKFLDYDNDGWKDLFVAQGHVMDNIELTQPSVRYREPLLLMRNTNGQFADVSGQNGEIFQRPLAARGAAFGDLNNDGLVDIAINCNDGPAVLLINRAGDGNHWLILNPVGTRSNRDGIGARVRITSQAGLEQEGFISTAGSYASANDKRIHFGLGNDGRPVTVEVTWPGGAVQRIVNVASNQVLPIKEPAGAVERD